MFHVYWPAVGALTLLIVLVIMIILMYGDAICARVQTQTEGLMTRRYEERQYREANMELQKRKASYGHEIEV